MLFRSNDELSLAPNIIFKICDRASGIGSDGLIRITKSDGNWFMDYRNRDGSLAEMCGNGIRLMAKYLVERGHQSEGIFAIDTRDGIKYLSVPKEGNISVNMGGVSALSNDIEVSANGNHWENGFNISVGNPHAVVFVENVEAAGDLKVAPKVEPTHEYPDGVNIEFVEFLDNGELKMRVHERGVGETRACGTGTCAVALAATLKKNQKLPSKWVIYPPGGRLEVEIDAHSNATLIGPAVLVRDCELDSYL